MAKTPAKSGSSIKSVGIAPPASLPLQQLFGGSSAPSYGGFDEAASRTANNSAPSGGGSSQIAFEGTIGGNKVQMYGPTPLSREQAMGILQSQYASTSKTGGTPVAMWQALNPNATPADLKAYKALNGQYKAQTEGQGIGQKLGNAVKFELDRAGNVIKGVANNPGQLLTGGIDPIGTKIGNAITGSHNQALVGQLGGATQQDFQRYEAKNGFGSLGAAPELSHSADAIAGMFGAVGAAHGLSQAFQGLTGQSTGTAPTQTYRGGANLDFTSAPVADGAAPAAAGAADPALDEIVVQGTRAGLSGGQLAALGAGGVGAGALLSGLSNTANPASSFATSQTNGTTGQLAQNGGIQGGAGEGSTSGITSGFGGSNMGWMDWVKDAANLAGAFESAQGNKDARNTLNGAQLSTTLGPSTIAGPGGSSAGVLANGAGGGFSLGDMEGMRAFLSQLGTQSSQNALTGGLPSNIADALASLKGASGLPGMSDTSGLQSQFDSLTGRAFNGIPNGSVAPGLQSQAFAGAGQQLADASRGFGDVQASTLANLRAQAKPEEDRAFDTLQNRQFSTGQMGSSGGALQTEAFARGLGQADLQRQLSANQEARTTQQNALGIGQGLASVGSNVAGLDDSLLSSAFGRFGQTAGLSSDLMQQRFGNSTLLNNMGFDRANQNFGTQTQAAQLPTALQGQQLQLALQALTGQGTLQNQGLAQFQAALAAATSGANARIGAGSVNAQLAGQASQIPSSADTWGQVLTGIGSRIGNTNGNGGGLASVLSGLFGGNKSTQPINSDAAWNGG